MFYKEDLLNSEFFWTMDAHYITKHCHENCYISLDDFIVLYCMGWEL